MTTENLHKNNMAKVLEQIRKRGERIEQPKQALKQENKTNTPLQPNIKAKKQVKILGFKPPKPVLKQENKANTPLQPNMKAKIIPSRSPENAPKTSQALAAQQKFQAVVNTKSQKTSDSKLNTYELQITKVLKTLTPEQKEKAGFAFTKANKTLTSQNEAHPALQQNMEAKIVPSGSPQVRQNAFNYEIRAPQPWPPKQKEHAPVFKAFNKISASQADNQAKFPEAKIWSSTPIKSPQDKHFHSSQKSNDSGIFFNANNSTEVNTTFNATDNLSKTFGVVQKDLMEKHNISVNPIKKNPSPVKDKIAFFNNLSRTSDSQESPNQIGLASRSILHIDNKNQPTPSAPPSPSTMDANKSFIVHMDTKNQPTPSAPPSPSTMDANKSSVGQNDAKKIPAKNNAEIIVGPREKRLMDKLKIFNDVTKGNKIKRLIDLFEPRKELSNVDVKAVNNPSKTKG